MFLVSPNFSSSFNSLDIENETHLSKSANLIQLFQCENVFLLFFDTINLTFINNKKFSVWKDDNLLPKSKFPLRYLSRKSEMSFSRCNYFHKYNIVSGQTCLILAKDLLLVRNLLQAKACVNSVNSDGYLFFPAEYYSYKLYSKRF